MFLRKTPILLKQDGIGMQMELFPFPHQQQFVVKEEAELFLLQMVILLAHGV